MPIRRSADARMSVNGILVAVRRFSQRIVSPAVDVSNSEAIPGGANVVSPFYSGGQLAGLSGTGGPCRSFTGDIKHAVIRFSCFYDDSNDPQLLPVAMIAEGWADVSWFPAGLAGLAYGPFSALVSEIEHSGEVGQGAQMVDFTLYTDGEFFLQ